MRAGPKRRPDESGEPPACGSDAGRDVWGGAGKARLYLADKVCKGGLKGGRTLRHIVLQTQS